MTPEQIAVQGYRQDLSRTYLAPHELESVIIISFIIIIYLLLTLIYHGCADPVPAAMLQEVLLAIADKHRKLAKRPQLIGLHGRVPNPQLVALMKDCWHPVRSCCLWQLSKLCQSHSTLAFSHP